MQLAEFIEASNLTATTDALFDLYLAAMRAQGFDRILFGLLTEHPTIGHKAQRVLMHNYPEAWMRLYSKKELVRIDPVRQYIPHAEGPFTWSSLAARMNLTRIQAECLRMANLMGLRDGVGVPLRGPRGALAGIGAASSAVGVIPTPNVLSKVGLLSQQFYSIFLSLEKKPQQNRQAVVVRLSPTEMKVLQWCANGNSRRESSAALGVSEETIKFHIRNIRHKLNARTSIIAINKAVRLGLIDSDPEDEEK